MTASPETARMATRFAPSPTGALHLGHAYSAAIAWRLAQQHGGSFRLRIDDIDALRSRGEYSAALRVDLDWLGIVPMGEVIFQSRRQEYYEQALKRLRTMGLLYPCFCTRSDIAASLAAPHHRAGARARMAGVIYPGTCRTLAQSERNERMTREAHCWRIDMQTAVQTAMQTAVQTAVQTAMQTEQHIEKPGWYEYFPGAWSDAGNASASDELSDSQGNALGIFALPSGVWIAANPSAQGDVVLARKDAPASYHLANVIDDAAMGISDVVRGGDLFESTHIHVLLQRLLDLPVPRYHHHALVCDANGRRLAKRDGAATLAAHRRSSIGSDVDGRVLMAQLMQDVLPAGYILRRPYKMET